MRPHLVIGFTFLAFMFFGGAISMVAFAWPHNLFGLTASLSSAAALLIIRTALRSR